ncbi:hypothetical protein [Streptomyces sp. NPDC096152]
MSRIAEVIVLAQDADEIMEPRPPGGARRRPRVEDPSRPPAW